MRGSLPGQVWPFKANRRSSKRSTHRAGSPSTGVLGLNPNAFPLYQLDAAP